MITDASLMDKIVSLAKRRGFVFPGSEIYGGLANSWDYGPLGVELKNNIKQLWWKRFVQSMDDMVGIDTALIMNPRVWEASGHLKNFNDPLVECKKCHSRARADKSDGTCVNCGGKDFTPARQFNLMFKTFVGPAEEQANVAYFRPETAQGMFVNFKNVLDTTRRRLPFGIAQIGKAFRNEITPGNFIFRTREFEQMEIEYFISPDDDWKIHFERWSKEMKEWMKDIGLDLRHVHGAEIPEEERAHYSKRTIDFEYDFPFGRSELYGLAYRTDVDLKNHQENSGQTLEYTDPESGKKFTPHVIEPTWGVDRSVLAVLCEGYREEPASAQASGEARGEGKDKRVYLKLPVTLAPFKVAVFPLLANKPKLMELARSIYDTLRPHVMTAWDDRGNIGKRYYSQDEIGTPFCITVDFESLTKGDVTVRDRDTMKQERISIHEVQEYISNKLEFNYQGTSYKKQDTNVFGI
ncbi:MAG: glycine--tRNA ligase [Patescibacteria group bacterium]